MEQLQTDTASPKIPRVAITYCTQCKWMLRAAYFSQELLSTFGTSIGEIALIPATGGIFQVHLTFTPPSSAGEKTGPQTFLLWDRKSEGGFPETKILKQRVRNYIEPGKDLGHSDTPAKKVAGNTEDSEAKEKGKETKREKGDEKGDGKECEDCQ